MADKSDKKLEHIEHLDNTDEKPMIIAGIAASQAIDSSAEVLDVEGCDITSLKEGKGYLNWEHLQKDNDKSVPGSEIVGKIIFAKKIFSAKDCEDELQEHFWGQAKTPFIYIVGRLFNAQPGHASSKHIAGIIRDAIQHKEDLVIGFSIEGSTLKRNGNKLTHCVAKNCAVTLQPCNKTAKFVVVSDPYLNIDGDVQIKKTELTPVFAKIGHHSMVYDQNLLKTLAAGSTDVAPSSSIQGPALQVEGLARKETKKKIRHKLLSALYKWDGSKNIRDLIRAEMPEVSEDFLDHFDKVVENKQVKLKKNNQSDASGETKDRGVHVKIPINNIFALNRWGHPLNPERFDYQVKHGHTSPPVKVELGTSKEVGGGDFVHSADPQTEEDQTPFHHERLLDQSHPKYFLSDGHHRLRAAQSRGETHIDAIVHVPEIPHYLKGDKRLSYENELKQEVSKLNNLHPTVSKTEAASNIALWEMKSKLTELSFDLQKALCAPLNSKTIQSNLKYAIQLDESPKVVGRLFQHNGVHHQLNKAEDLDWENLLIVSEEQLLNKSSDKNMQKIQELLHELANPHLPTIKYAEQYILHMNGQESNLTVSPNAVYMNGHLLDQDEIQRIKDAVKARTAKLESLPEKEKMAEIKQAIS